MSDDPTGTPFHCPRFGDHEPHHWDPDNFGDTGPYWCDGKPFAGEEATHE